MEQGNVEQAPTANEPVNQPQQEVSSVSPSSQSSKKPLVIVGILLGFVLFGVGGYILGMQRGSQGTIKNNTAITPTSHPAAITETLPTNTPTTTPTNFTNPQSQTSWKPSIELFVVNVPSDWSVAQGDGGAGSVDWLKSPTSNGKLESGANVEIRFGGLSEGYPEGVRQEVVSIGSTSATKMIERETVYLHIKDVYSPVKKGQYNLLIVYSRDDPEISSVEDILDSILLTPSAEQLSTANTIP